MRVLILSLLLATSLAVGGHRRPSPSPRPFHSTTMHPTTSASPSSSSTPPFDNPNPSPAISFYCALCIKYSSMILLKGREFAHSYLLNDLCPRAGLFKKSCLRALEHLRKVSDQLKSEFDPLEKSSSNFCQSVGYCFVPDIFEDCPYYRTGLPTYKIGLFRPSKKHDEL
ncbi:unnamed protein product, partial [Mesorhabditis spiculigera]